MTELMTLKEFVSKAMMTPFKPRGRDFSGWDCWGMFKCAYQHVNGVMLPSFADEYESTRASNDLAELVAAGRDRIGQWQKISSIDASNPMDGVILKYRGLPVHIGLVISRKKFLHTEAGINTIVEDFRNLPSQDSVEGIYRYVDD
jgi:cell wall-associated NlpC family hydrolase